MKLKYILTILDENTGALLSATESPTQEMLEESLNQVTKKAKETFEENRLDQFDCRECEDTGNIEEEIPATQEAGQIKNGKIIKKPCLECRR